MTLGIAAFSDSEKDGQHIVACCDWRIETPIGSAETQLKFRHISAGWAALLAGDDINHAMELCDRYSSFLIANKESLTLANVQAELRRVPNEY